MCVVSLGVVDSMLPYVRHEVTGHTPYQKRNMKKYFFDNFLSEFSFKISREATQIPVAGSRL